MIENTVHPKTNSPSIWVIRFASQMKPRGTVLDLACGGGRNGRWFLEAGHRVTFLDRDVSALTDLHNNPKAEVLCSNLEKSAHFPIGGQRFDVYPQSILTGAPFSAIEALQTLFLRGGGEGHTIGPLAYVRRDNITRLLAGQA